MENECVQLNKFIPNPGIQLYYRRTYNLRNVTPRTTFINSERIEECTLVYYRLYITRWCAPEYRGNIKKSNLPQINTTTLKKKKLKIIFLFVNIPTEKHDKLEIVSKTK